MCFLSFCFSWRASPELARGLLKMVAMFIRWLYINGLTYMCPLLREISYVTSAVFNDFSFFYCLSFLLVPAGPGCSTSSDSLILIIRSSINFSSTHIVFFGVSAFLFHHMARSSVKYKHGWSVIVRAAKPFGHRGFLSPLEKPTSPVSTTQHDLLVMSIRWLRG